MVAAAAVACAEFVSGRATPAGPCTPHPSTAELSPPSGSKEVAAVGFGGVPSADIEAALVVEKGKEEGHGGSWKERLKGKWKGLWRRGSP